MRNGCVRARSEDISRAKFRGGFTKTVTTAKRQLHSEPQSIRQAYANSLRLTDEHLGYLVNELEERRLLDDTTVIITSDHAFPLGKHGRSHTEAAFYACCLSPAPRCVGEGHPGCEWRKTSSGRE
jgi:membrane-anchored protein YejM (alkaline phosphatase superfamily)